MSRAGEASSRPGSDWRIRRPHRKTRTGCNQCKRRRVKCDERKPICTNCERNRLPCGLAFLTPVRVAVRSPPVRVKSQSPVEIEPQEPLQANEGTRSIPGPALNIRYGDMDLRSTEILHHYTSTVCKIIAGPKVVQTWQVIIPQLALEHEFLMHGIKALSALHLAALLPNRRKELVVYAVASEQLALPPFRSFISEKELGPSKLHAVFAFSHFVVPYMLASSGSLEGPMGRIPSYEGQPHWFHALRGYMSFLFKCWDDLKAGPLGYQLVRSPMVPVVIRDHPEDIHLARINEILEPKVGSTLEEKRELGVCKVALEELRDLWSGPYMAGKLAIVAMIYLWPYKVTLDYIALMHRHRPEALVILAHYALLVKRMNMLWYLKGVGAKLQSAIDEALADEFKPYIKWALDEPAG